MGRLVYDLCSKQYVKLWVFWDVDTETLKACKKDDVREKMRCSDGCIRQLHGTEDSIEKLVTKESRKCKEEEEETEKDGNKARKIHSTRREWDKKKRITTLYAQKMANTHGSVK